MYLYIQPIKKNEKIQTKSQAFLTEDDFFNLISWF